MVPLRSGRDFEAGDRVGSPPVAIVDEAFVRRFLSGEQPIGQRVRLGRDEHTRYEIVGVVADAVLIAAGLALGLGASLWAARFVEALLFQLEARDPVTFAGAAAVLVAVGVLAAWLPARRAARLDPATCCATGSKGSRAYPPQRMWRAGQMLRGVGMSRAKP
ncbi:MAG: ABC transporter permease [Acidobacteria bacterium]|nr:ABC transporter permease [Acidobacteriota bacterium]